MRHLIALPIVFGLSASTVACGGGGAGSSSSAAVQFGAPSLSACTQGTAMWVGSGDFNGDGHPDLLVACDEGSSSTANSVLLNQGDGTFATPVGGPSGLLDVVDVNGDGRDDVIDTDYNGVSFAQADGTFGSWVKIPQLPTGCHDFTHDWNGDGWKDALCYFESSLRALSFNADGSTLEIFSMTVPRQPIPVDLNGDGKLDFVYASGSSIVAQLNTGGNVFAAAQAIVTLDATTSPPQFADIDGDGYIDMLVTAGSSSTGHVASVLHNKSGTGFELWNQFPSVDGVNYTFQEVTGDGLADMILSQDAQLMVLAGKGDGTFASGGDPLTGPWSRTATTLFLDLNGDGKSDLVIPDGSVSILLQQN